MKTAADAQGYTLPDTCSFSSQRDMYWPLEKETLAYRSKFRCGICRITDKVENNIRQHIIDKHPEVFSDHVRPFSPLGAPHSWLTIAQGGDICLADLCDVLECPSTRTAARQRRASSACSEADMQRSRFDCLSMMHTCFPPSKSDVTHELNSAFDRLFCRRLRCGYVEPDNEYHGELLATVRIFPPSYSSLLFPVLSLYPHTHTL